MEKQFTATVFIVDEEKVLLLLHPKLKKWLPPGGHIEPNETPPECAIREALEETGLHIELIKDEHVWISRWNAISFERPWLCLLEIVPAYKDKPEHQHIDFLYLGKQVGGSIGEEHLKQQDIRWFTCEEVLALAPDEDIFVETQQVIQKIFEKVAADQLL